MKWVLGILALAVVVTALLWLQAYKEKFDVVRATITAAARELAVAREAVDADFARTKAMPPPRDFPPTAKQVRSIKLEPDGRLVATLALPDSAGDRHIIHEPRIAGATLEWRCHTPDLDKKFLPAACR